MEKYVPLPSSKAHLARKNNLLVWSKLWLNQTPAYFSELPFKVSSWEARTAHNGYLQLYTKANDSNTLPCSPLSKKGAATPTWGTEVLPHSLEGITGPYNELSLQQPPSRSNLNCKDNIFSQAFSSATATFKLGWPGCDDYIFHVLPSACSI